MSDQEEKVFCLGFSKTGTTSLEKALEILGYNVCKGHWNLKHNDYLLALWIHGDKKEILKLSEYWDAFADAPWGGTDLYKDLFERYPDAKFILTIRDTDEWYRSMIKNFTRFNQDLRTALESHHRNHRFGAAYFFKVRFGVDSLEKQEERMKRIFEEHNKQVEDFFREKASDRFLKLDLTQAKEWGSLCRFLDKPIPDEEFPHANPSHKNGKASKTASDQNASHDSLLKKGLRKIKGKFQ